MEYSSKMYYSFVYGISLERLKGEEDSLKEDEKEILFDFMEEDMVERPCDFLKDEFL